MHYARGKLNLQSFPAYQADQWSEEHPTEFPPATWPIANHVFNVLIKPFSSCSIRREKGECLCYCGNCNNKSKALWGDRMDIL